MLLATQSLLARAGDMQINRNGASVATASAAPRFSLSNSELEETATFTNEGEGPIFASVNVFGAPETAPPPEAAGFEISKRVATLDGRIVDLNTVQQNDRLVIVLTRQAY